jgi:hypothetical protein
VEDPRYADRNWLRGTRRWPPRLCTALEVCARDISSLVHFAMQAHETMRGCFAVLLQRQL